MQRVPEASRLCRWLAVMVSIIVTGGGVAGLTIWALADLPPIGTSGPFDPPRPEPSASLALAGPALLLLTGSPGAVRRHAGHALGAVVTVIGLLGVLDHLGLDTADLIPIRSLLGTAALGAGEFTAGAATALLLSGLSLMLIDASPGRWLAWSQGCALGATAIALVTILAYVFIASRDESGLTLAVSMPRSSAIGILVLAFGVFLARPEHGLMRPLTSSGPGGVLARRLVPTLVLVPFGIVLLAALVIRLWHGQPALALSLSTALFLVIVVLALSGTFVIIDEAAARRERVLDELAAERDFTGTLLHSLCEAVVVFDRDLQVVDANPRATEVLGLPRDRLLGQRPPYSWQADGQQTDAATDATEAAPDQVVRRPDGTLVPVLARMSAVLDQEHGPRAYVGTFVDIADRKDAEDQLVERAAELEQANSRLLQSNERLSDAAAFKRDLMSLVSHELSQPLSSVASLSELLASDWDDLPDAIRLELTQKIDKNARRLTGMINDMVLLFRLDAGAVEARRESVPVAEVVDTIADTAPDTAQIVATVDPDLCALVDRGHLSQVLTNLVKNAMTHGEPPIEISAERDVDGVVVSVRDYGEGIAEDHLPHLFDRVAPRRSGGGRRSTGSGLGLFIVRHLVEANAGTIWYEHADPRGARISIRLELAAGPPQPAGRHHAPAAPTVAVSAPGDEPAVQPAPATTGATGHGRMHNSPA